MKTIAIILFAALSFASGCATDPESDDPQSLKHPNFEDRLEIFEPEAPDGRAHRIDDGRSVWAEEVVVGDSRQTHVHHIDSETGIDSLAVLDEHGDVVDIITRRLSPAELWLAGKR